MKRRLGRSQAIPRGAYRLTALLSERHCPANSPSPIGVGHGRERGGGGDAEVIVLCSNISQARTDFRSVSTLVEQFNTCMCPDRSIAESLFRLIFESTAAQPKPQCGVRILKSSNLGLSYGLKMMFTL